VYAVENKVDNATMGARSGDEDGSKQFEIDAQSEAAHCCTVVLIWYQPRLLTAQTRTRIT